MKYLLPVLQLSCLLAHLALAEFFLAEVKHSSSEVASKQLVRIPNSFAIIWDAVVFDKIDIDCLGKWTHQISGQYFISQGVFDFILLWISDRNSQH